MEIIIRGIFGECSGVSESLIGREMRCLVASKDDMLLVVGEILSLLAQGCDISVSQLSE